MGSLIWSISVNRRAIRWFNLEDPMNKMKYFTSQLNQLFIKTTVVFGNWIQATMAEIIDADNRDQSVLLFIRKGKKGEMPVCASICTSWTSWRTGLPDVAVRHLWRNLEYRVETSGKRYNQTVQTQEGLWKDYEQTWHTPCQLSGASIWKTNVASNLLSR